MTYTGLFSLKITMVTVPSGALVLLLKYKYSVVVWGTSTMRELAPNALLLAFAVQKYMPYSMWELPLYTGVICI